MILSDREIRAAVDRKALKITPLPSEERWSSTAIDLTLASEIAILMTPHVGGVQVPVSPADPNYNYGAFTKEHHDQKVISPDGYKFKSGEFLLGWTVEKIRLPFQSRLAARVEGKSSLARLGVGVHVTAPTIHAGFGDKHGDDNYPGSPLQLEIWNCGPLDIILKTGMPICQLIFELVDGTPAKGYQGKFSVQGPAR